MRVCLKEQHPFLARDALFVDLDRRDELRIDAGHVAYVDPLTAAGILILALDACAQGRPVTLELPEAEEPAAELARLGLFDALPPTVALVGGRVPLDAVDDSFTVPLRRVDPDPDRFLAELHEDVVRFGRGTAHRVFKAVSELTTNSCEHGQSPLGVHVAGRIREGRGSFGLDIAVVDAGIGVLSHLTLNPAHRRLASPREAIKAATLPDVTGTADSDRGFGLPQVLKCLNDMNGGELVILSGSAVGSFRHSLRGGWTERIVDGGWAESGTWTSLRLRLPRESSDSPKPVDLAL